MNQLKMRGVRGAVTVDENLPEQITAATKRLLTEMIRRNAIETDDIASVLFSLTPDLQSSFPALAAREMGWVHVPMLHFTEIAVPGAMPRVVRVLMHVNTARGQQEIEHVYLDGAAALRPDLTRPARS